MDILSTTSDTEFVCYHSLYSRYTNNYQLLVPVEGRDGDLVNMFFVTSRYNALSLKDDGFQLLLDCYKRYDIFFPIVNLPVLSNIILQLATKCVFISRMARYVISALSIQHLKQLSQ